MANDQCRTARPSLESIKALKYRSERNEVGKTIHLRCNVIDLLAFKRVLNGHGVRHRAWLF